MGWVEPKFKEIGSPTPLRVIKFGFLAPFAYQIFLRFFLNITFRGVGGPISLNIGSTQPIIQIIRSLKKMEKNP